MSHEEQQKLCEYRFDEMFERLEHMETIYTKQSEKNELIERAIIEIQTSTKLTAQTLAKLEERFEISTRTNSDRLYKIVEKAIYILAGIILTLLGKNVDLMSLFK